MFTLSIAPIDSKSSKLSTPHSAPSLLLMHGMTALYKCKFTSSSSSSPSSSSSSGDVWICKAQWVRFLWRITLYKNHLLLPLLLWWLWWPWWWWWCCCCCLSSLLLLLLLLLFLITISKGHAIAQWYIRYLIKEATKPWRWNRTFPMWYLKKRTIQVHRATERHFQQLRRWLATREYDWDESWLGRRITFLSAFTRHPDTRSNTEKN